MVTVVIEGDVAFFNFNLSCNVSSISNQSFADAHSSNITRLTLQCDQILTAIAMYSVTLCCDSQVLLKY